MLWVALELPSLPLQIAERAGASQHPLVISEGTTQRPLVACANVAARDAGIRAGQAVAAAKALAGDLKVIERDPAAEREALERLAAWAGQFTPMSCIDGQGIALEVESSLKLFDGHAKLTAAIRRGMFDLGFNTTLGVAPTPLAARVFARAEAQGRAMRSCIALADLTERLGELPVFLLEWPAKTLAHLTDLGLLRLRDLFALPTEGIARRFGPETVVALDHLRGRLPDPREPYVPPSRFCSRLELPADAECVEALLFPLRRMLVEMEGHTRGRGSGVQHLALVLEHSRKARTRVELEFASPERECDFILGIAREKLGRLALPAATVALSLRADALLAFTPRSSTWLPGAEEQALDSARLVERLTARMGKERVFGIAIANDHRPGKDWAPACAGATSRHPDATSRHPDATSRHPDATSRHPGATSRHPGATSRHPGATTRHPGEGRDPISRRQPPATSAPRPAWLLNRPHRLITHNGLPTYQGDLTLAAGPERIEAGWWDGEEVRRDYYVASNPRGETFWIFREHRDPGSWFLHGVFA